MHDKQQVLQRMNRAQRVWEIEGSAVKNLQSQIDSDQFSRACDLIHGAKRTALSGVGTSAQVAKKIAHTLSCIEIPALFLDASDAVHGGLGAVQPGDVMILISKGGNTAEITALLHGLKIKKDVSVIGVTEDPESKIARESDLPLIVAIEQEADEFNMLATANTMAVTAVFDALAVVLMEERGFTQEQFLAIHPGGAVGDRLRKNITNEANRGKT